MEGEVWIQDYKMQTRVSKEPKYRGLDGEDNECRLCKHCGYMLNTDYIWLHKSGNSEKIDPHADQKQEIDLSKVEIGIFVNPIMWKLFLSVFSKW